MIQITKIIKEVKGAEPTTHFEVVEVRDSVDWYITTLTAEQAKEVKAALNERTDI